MMFVTLAYQPHEVFQKLLSNKAHHPNEMGDRTEKKDCQKFVMNLYLLSRKGILQTIFGPVICRAE
jgi:hypothetical protein